MDTSGFDLSELEDIEFFWENPQGELDFVFRPETGTPFSPTGFNDLEKREEGSNGSVIVLDAEKDNEKSFPTFPVPEHLTEPPRLLRSQLLGNGIGNMPEYVYKTPLE